MSGRTLYNDRVSIQDIVGKFKGILSNNEVFTALLVILVAVVSFGLGRASVEPRLTPEEAPAAARITVQNPAEKAVKSETETIKTAAPESGVTTPTATGEVTYVASKSGTKYHLPWCPGAKQMKEENKIFFDSKEEAEAAGYTPATNCKGI